MLAPGGASRLGCRDPASPDEGGNALMTQDLAYDMMLEAQGLIRSFRVRMSLDRELRIGETFSTLGRHASPRGEQ